MQELPGGPIRLHVSRLGLLGGVWLCEWFDAWKYKRLQRAQTFHGFCGAGRKSIEKLCLAYFVLGSWACVYNYGLMCVSLSYALLEIADCHSAPVGVSSTMHLGDNLVRRDLGLDLHCRLKGIYSGVA